MQYQKNMNSAIINELDKIKIENKELRECIKDLTERVNKLENNQSTLKNDLEIVKNKSTCDKCEDQGSICFKCWQIQKDQEQNLVKYA